MSSTPEAIGEILSFVPENPERKLEVDLGKVDEDTGLTYGIYPYPKRLVGFPGEPFTGDWTRQPVLALKSRGKDGQVTACYPLAYAADVRALRGDLVSAILDRLAATPARRQIL